MPIAEAKYIWYNGKLVAWKEATVHVMAHALHYGSSVFEGIRCYNSKRGPAVFCLSQHIRRLYDSAKIYRMTIPYSQDEIKAAICQTIIANGQNACYIRPIAFRGYGEIGVDPRKCPVDVAIGTIEWGRYLGADAIEQGVDVCVSSWTHISSNTIPTLAKGGANYANSALIKMESVENGYSEAIALDKSGLVTEASGENLFLVRDNRLYTAPLSSTALSGITRGCVLTLAKELGYEVCETGIPREMLYIADELFMTGTAAEITPVRSVDKIIVGAGKCGPITAAIQKRFFNIVEGLADDRYGWLTAVC